jgi:hypothetical protein
VRGAARRACWPVDERCRPGAYNSQDSVRWWVLHPASDADSDSHVVNVSHDIEGGPKVIGYW